MPASKRIGRHSTDGGCESTDDHDRNDWQHHDDEDAEEGEASEENPEPAATIEELAEKHGLSAGRTALLDQEAML